VGGGKGILANAVAAAALLICASSAHPTWQPAVPVSSASSSPNEDLTLASNARGEAFVVWHNWGDSYNSTLRRGPIRSSA
jgi:hypothetical protein